jgi:hypothetical protein
MLVAKSAMTHENSCAPVGDESSGHFGAEEPDPKREPGGLKAP